MAQITKEITVDVAKKNLFQAIIAKQNDSNSRFLKVTLCNEGEQIIVPSTASVLINAERADNTSAGFMGTVNSDGTVTVPLTNWMLALDDVVKCSISVIDTEEQKLTSTSFSIDVEAAEYSGDNITDDENYDILLSLISEVAETKKDCETATTNAVTVTDKANLATTAANDAATAANTAAENANTAAENANNATTAAETAETARAEAEAGRATAEEARVEAEEAREAASAEAVENCETAAKTLLEQVNRIAFSLNSEDGGLDIIVYEEVA